MINCKKSAKLILGTLCAMALAMPTLTSCEHKDLCFDHDVHAPKFDFRVTATYQQEWELNENQKVWASEAEWPEKYGMAYDDLYSHLYIASLMISIPHRVVHLVQLIQWIRRLGLAYAHCSIWNDWLTGSCSMAQGTPPNIL